MLEAFQQRDLGDFVYSLEFLNADVNAKDESGLPIFLKILKTPKSGAYIGSCVSNGADLYTVTNYF
jgi:hypothetical protein